MARAWWSRTIRRRPQQRPNCASVALPCAKHWNGGNLPYGTWRLPRTRVLDFALRLRDFNDLGRFRLAPRREFNASDRGIRDPFGRWSWRAVPRGFFCPD